MRDLLGMLKTHPRGVAPDTLASAEKSQCFPVTRRPRALQKGPEASAVRINEAFLQVKSKPSGLSQGKCQDSIERVYLGVG
ncbi:hypothetical protein AOLI_G00022640 [Acnodon oligacanthus]